MQLRPEKNVLACKDCLQRSNWSTEFEVIEARGAPDTKSGEGYFTLRARQMHTAQSPSALRNWVCVSIFSSDQRTGAGLVVLARGKRNHVQDKMNYSIHTPFVEGVFSPDSKKSRSVDGATFG